MRSRWYHTPLLHVPREGGGARKVSWLEIFYDLLFVSALVQLGDALRTEPSIEGVARYALYFVPFWITWTGFTLYANRFDVDDFLHRAATFAQMCAVGAMAITSRAAMGVEASTWGAYAPAGFAISCASAQGLLALMYMRTWRQELESRDYSRYWGMIFAAGGTAFALSVALPHPWRYLFWALGLGVILSGPLSGPARRLSGRYPTDMRRLSERHGVLTSALLGVSALGAIAHLTDGYTGGLEAPLRGALILLLLSCIWWIYFDDVAGSKIRERRGAGIIWFYSHLPMLAALTALSASVEQAFPFELAAPAPIAHRWLLAGALSLTLLSAALIDSVTERRNNNLSDRSRVMVRAASAAVVFLIGQVGGVMNAGLFLTLLVAICLGQVLFDLMMVPNEESGRSSAAVPTSTLAQMRIRGAKREDLPRASLGQAVRRGAPSAARQDLYFFFMEGSWLQFMVASAFIYVLLNILFASLYALDPSSIAGGASFEAAFFFSVQTMSTIGYGALSPTNAYGDLLVSMESWVGILFVALVTGLVFAKASRPRAGALFSERCVITRRNGQPTLMLRIANGRGNEVVDATATIAALIDEISTEGHHMRRIRDLSLVRDRQPMFALSWTLMHTIDEDSPFYEGAPGASIVGLIVTLVGYDSTYGQTTYARKLYNISDVLPEHRFVDVISQLPDGRLVLDLERFHDTLPERSTTPTHEE